MAGRKNEDMINASIHSSYRPSEYFLITVKAVSGGGELIEIKGEIAELTGLLQQFAGATPEVQCALISAWSQPAFMPVISPGQNPRKNAPEQGIIITYYTWLDRHQAVLRSKKIVSVFTVIPCFPTFQYIFEVITWSQDSGQLLEEQITKTTIGLEVAMISLSICLRSHHLRCYINMFCFSQLF